MRSNHRTVIIDWETNKELPEKKEQEENRRKATNKQYCEKMTQNNWEKYKEHMREKLKNQEERIREPEKIDTQQRLQTLQKWMNEALEQEQRNKEEEKEKKEEKKHIHITKLNITLNTEQQEEKEIKKRKEGEGEYKSKLSKRTNGKTAKQTKIRNRLYSYTKTIKKIIKGKKKELRAREWN